MIYWIVVLDTYLKFYIYEESLFVNFFNGGVSALAQEPLHGVDGYYNWTAAQLKASDALGVGNSGKKVKGWYPEVGYTDDMEYVRFTMGINNNVNETEWGGFQHRSELVLKENTPGEGVMTITRAYPVVAFKFSIPENNEGTGVLSGYFEPQFNAYDADGNGGRLWLNGLDGNSRARLVHYSGAGVLTDALGRDSVQLNKGNYGYSSYRTANTVHKEYKDTIWHVVRLAPSIGEQKTDLVVAMDLSTICGKAESGDGGIRQLDTMDIKLSGFSLGFLGVHADTLVRDDNGIARTKTKEERPAVYLKWIKTFASMKEFDASLSKGNGGDHALLDVEISPVGMSTYYDSRAYTLPQGVRAGVVNWTDGKVVVDWCYQAGDVVPPCTGVLLQGSEGKYTCLEANERDAVSSSSVGNYLKGTNRACQVSANGYRYYKLANGSKGLGFYFDTDGGVSVNNGAHKAYLALPAEMGVNAHFISLDGTTGVSAVTAEGEKRVDVTDLMGAVWKRDVSKSEALDGLPEGIYIMEGKKYIVK